MIATKVAHKPEPIAQRTLSGRRPASARRRQAQQALARYAVHLALVVAAALTVAASSVRVARQGQELVALKEELRLLEADNKRMEAEAIGLQSLARIEREAASLGLQRPRVVRPVPFVPAPANAPETLAEARPARSGGGTGDGGPVQAGAFPALGLKSVVGAIDRLAEMLAGWFSGN